MADSSSEEKWQVRSVRPGLAKLDKLQDLGLPDLSRVPWLNHPIRPADIGGELREAMLTRENMLEDVNYQKVVPNRYLVEVSEGNYARQFRPIEGQILRQWRERLLEELVTANSRQGRKEFRFGGRLHLEVRPAVDLKDTEARILSRVEPDSPMQVSRPRAQGPQNQPNQPRQQGQPQQGQQPNQPNQPWQPSPVTPPPAAKRHVVPPIHPASQPARANPTANPPPVTRPEPPRSAAGSSATGGGAATSGGAATGSGAVSPPPGGQAAAAAYLELVPTGQRWSLYPGMNTIGRSEACQIYLSQPIIQEKRLISGQHAFVVMENGLCTLYDGSPDGRPSANGTYVNLRRVPPTGYRLQNGDAIVLAALDPLYPRSDTPGVATFYFWTDRRP